MAEHKTYEGMFILTPASTPKDWEDARAEVETILTKHGSKIHIMDKWSDRKLPYPIQKNQRATYVLSYFDVAGDSIPKILGDCKLSDIVMRTLILQYSDQVPTTIDPPPPPVPPRTFERRH